jgi:DNA-directed RNA polymerase subunit alpha
MIPLPSQPKIIKKEDNRAVFEIEGLYPGYGITIGNSLRRVLLSSLEGAAVTKVRIKGVQHEFSTISGIKEDIIDICQNLKKLRFELFTSEPQKATLQVKGEKEVIGEDFNLPSQVKLVSKSVPIATITSKGTTLEMEIQIESGRGYASAEQMKEKEKLSVGEIQLDAIFNPVKSVAFHVENMRVGERTDFNKLKVDITTDGTLDPEEVLYQASEILVKHFSLISESFTPEDKKEKKPEKKKEKKEKKKKKESKKKEEVDPGELAIEDLDISSRTANALIGNNIKTLAGLLQRKEETLLEMEGLGEKGIKEIKSILKKHNLELK